jgi:aspartate aminotransferase-like enzyme
VLCFETGHFATLWKDMASRLGLLVDFVAATRAAVRAWGLEVLCADSREYSGSLTAVLMPAEHDADKVREIILDRFDMSLGTGLGRLAGVPIDPSGVNAALEVLRAG